MRALPVILFTTGLMLLFATSKAQTGISMDSVYLSANQGTLFVAPKKHLLVTHFDGTVGAARVMKGDRSGLGFAAAVKGLYSFTGALYLNMGLGVSRLSSQTRPIANEPAGKNTLTAITLPVGIGFSIGDDRAQIVNSIDFLPVYNADMPDVKRSRQFSYGFGIDLGFHIRIKQRLHLGMMAKLQMFQPFDKNERQSFPRYGFAGGGLLLRYD